MDPERLPSSIRTAVEAVASQLQGLSGWLVSGSCAAVLHGAPWTPNDVDIWCKTTVLNSAASLVGREVVIEERDGWVVESFRYRAAGWTIEVVGRVVRHELIMEVDDAMLGACTGRPMIEAASDLIAELLILNRPSPKCDVQRARELFGCAGIVADLDSIAARLQAFGVKRRSLRNALRALE